MRTWHVRSARCWPVSERRGRQRERRRFSRRRQDRQADSRRFMELPRYLRTVEGGPALAAVLAEICREMRFGRLCLVTGRSVSREAAGELLSELDPAAGAAVLRVTGNDAAEVRSLLSRKEFANADAALAIGGGKAIDVAKAACLEAGKPVISCPTQLAADGVASPVSVIRNDLGQIESLPGRMPAAVVCDLELVAAAPADSLRAGFGDLVSNTTALRDWRLAADAGKERLDDFAALLAQAGADLALGADPSLLADGEPESGLLRRLLEGLVLSGLAMEIAGSSRPCSGAEHMISHAFDRLAPGTAMHGEQAAFGTLVAAYLQGSDWRALRDTLATAGLRGAMSGFGLPREKLLEVIRAAPSTRPGRYTVLDEADLSEDAVAELLEVVLSG